MTRPRGAAVVLALAFLASDAGAALSTLRKPLSARASSLGEAYAAVPGGVSSLGTNPAGLAAAKRPQLETNFQSGVLDDTFGFFGWGQPLPLGTAAAGLSYYDGGKVELVFPGGRTEARQAARDFVGHLAWAVSLPWGISAGAMGKFFTFELAEEAKASGAALDAGAQWATPLKGLTLGGAMQNAGPGVAFERDRDPLPLTLRGGASYQWVGATSPDTEIAAPSTIRALTTAEAIKTRDERVVGAAGAEIGMDFGLLTLSLRGGFRFNTNSDGPTFGLGMRERRFTLDYALGDKRGLGHVHNASFGVRF